MTALTKESMNARDSSFELIRLVAQYMIVLYHILSVVIYPLSQEAFHKAIWLPLHIGVPLFVLISGYFGIRASVKGLTKLVGMIFVLQVPLLIVNHCINGGGIKELVKIGLFISETPFWFMRTYLFLYIFSPVINRFLKDISFRNRLLLLIVLFFMSHYIGTLKADPSLLDGKNLVTFLFLYVVGNTLHHYYALWKSISAKWLWMAYLSLNVILVLFFTFYDGMPLCNALYERICFAYCSPVLLVNTLLFFMLIGRMRFHSQKINHLAKSSLAIYMLHGTPLMIFGLIKNVAIMLYTKVDNGILLFLSLMLLAAVVVVVCIIVDNILNPVWSQINRLGILLQTKYTSLCISVDTFAKRYNL